MTFCVITSARSSGVHLLISVESNPLPADGVSGSWTETVWTFTGQFDSLEEGSQHSKAMSCPFSEAGESERTDQVF